MTQTGKWKKKKKRKDSINPLLDGGFKLKSAGSVQVCCRWVNKKPFSLKLTATATTATNLIRVAYLTLKNKIKEN